MPKDKKKIAAMLLVSFLLISATFTVGLALANKLLFRYALLFAGAQALFTVIFRSISLHNNLSAITLDPNRGKKSADFKSTLKKIKLHSEIAAGIAIASLMFNVYKSGIEFDQFNTNKRGDYVSAALSQFNDLVSENCEMEVISIRKNACKEIRDSFKLISESFNDGDVIEANIKREARNINVNIGYFASRGEEEKVSNIRDLISRFSIELGFVYKILSFILPLLFLLASTYAISGKVAVVLYEAREKEEKTQPILFLHPPTIGHRIRVYFLCRC